MTMAKNIEKIATGLGAKVVARIPHAGGGANWTRGLGPTAFGLLETCLRGADSRNRIRGRLSQVTGPRNHAD
jgi:hypothetical protein